MRRNAVLLKLYICGDLNRVQSSRRPELETRRNVEPMWLTERLTPDHKTIADLRKDKGKAILRACREFIVLCRRLQLFSEAVADVAFGDTVSATFIRAVAAKVESSRAEEAGSQKPGT